MGQAAALVEDLKRHLKTRGITYKALAKELGLTEAAVKRAFAAQAFSLRRLEQICTVLRLDFADLLPKGGAGADAPHLRTLSEEQELFLASDPRLFSFCYLLLGGKTIQQIQSGYRISKDETRRFLLALDKQGIIELHPGNRVVVRLSQDFRWRPRGPLIQAYGKTVLAEFFEESFEGPDRALQYAGGPISRSSLDVFSRKLNKLLQEFNEMSRIDRQANLPTVGNVSCFVGFRPWTFSVISGLKRR